MASEQTGQTILVAVEDLSTAGAVIAEAARLVTEQRESTVILLHVLDEHTVVNSILGMTGYGEMVKETATEGQGLLSFAEQALRAECLARHAAVPTIISQVAEGRAGEAIARAAETHHAALILVGARRPHLFGRLAHPDVSSHLSSHARCPVRVAPLQEVRTQDQP